jgi:hypothetical protein
MEQANAKLLSVSHKQCTEYFRKDERLQPVLQSFRLVLASLTQTDAGRATCKLLNPDIQYQASSVQCLFIL